MTEGPAMGALERIDATSPETLQNPYPYYDRLRREAGQHVVMPAVHPIERADGDHGPTFTDGKPHQPVIIAAHSVPSSFSMTTRGCHQSPSVRSAIATM